MRFILAPILIAIGLLVMKYTVQVTDFTGRLDFAEKYLGGGLAAGTYTWWRLCGLGLVILSAMWLFGLMGMLGSGLAGILGVQR
jgi:hypothetical protein